MSCIEYIMSPQHMVYNVEKAEFIKILDNVGKALKCHGTTREFTRYIHNELVYESGVKNDHVKTFRKTPISFELYSNNNSNSKFQFYKSALDKEKIPYYMFPSTRQIFDDPDVTCTVFKLHNNVHIHFEVQVFSSDNTIVHKIFISHTVDERDDADTVKKALDRAFTLLC